MAENQPTENGQKSNGNPDEVLRDDGKDDVLPDVTNLQPTVNDNPVNVDDSAKDRTENADEESAILALVDISYRSNLQTEKTPASSKSDHKTAVLATASKSKKLVKKTPARETAELLKKVQATNKKLAKQLADQVATGAGPVRIAATAKKLL